MRKKAILLLLTLAVTLGLLACGNKEKRSILSDDVKQEVAMQENETKKLIDDGDFRTVDVHVRRLRSKLDKENAASIINTVFGIGYVMR